MPLRHLSTAELLRRYLNGALTAPEEAELERRAREDDATAEALQGLRQHPAEDHLARTQRLKLAARAAAGNQAVAEKKKRPLVFYLSAAAAVLLLVTAIFLLPRWTDDGSADLALRTATEPAPAAESPESEEQLKDVDATESAPAAESLALEEETKAPAATKPAAREALTVPAPSSDTPHLRPRPTEPAAAPAPPPPPAEVRREQEQAEDLAEERAPIQSRKREAPAPAGPPSNYRTAPPAPTAAYQKQQANADAEQGAKFSAPELLIGRVTNEGGEPIYNALVRLPGLPLGERTDTNGIFRLEVDAVASMIEVVHPDYEAEQLEFSDASENLQVSLEEKVEKDYREWTDSWAKTKIPLRKEPGLALPAEGYNALRRRIETQRPAEVPPGKVKLSFLVHPDGTVSDFVFRGRPDQATMDYIGGTIANGSTWKIVRGEEAVRVYFKVVLE